MSSSRMMIIEDRAFKGSFELSFELSKSSLSLSSVHSSLLFGACRLIRLLVLFPNVLHYSMNERRVVVAYKSTQASSTHSYCLYVSWTSALLSTCLKRRSCRIKQVLCELYSTKLDKIYSALEGNNIQYRASMLISGRCSIIGYI